MAGLGTTGVLIGSFFLLLTVGSTLVAFKGVPGAASNGDLSSIELRQQQAAAQRESGLLASADILGVHLADGSSAADDVLGRLATSAASDPTGRIFENAAGAGPDALRPGDPGSPLNEKAPSSGSPTPAPSSGVVAAPVTPGDLADDSSSDSGSGTDSGSDTGSGSDSGTGTGSGSDSGTATDDSGTGSTDAGDSSGSDSGSDGGSDTGSGGTGDTVTDPVEDTTDTAGEVTSGGSQAVEDTAGGLLGDAAAAVDELTDALSTAG